MVVSGVAGRCVRRRYAEFTERIHPRREAGNQQKGAVPRELRQSSPASSARAHGARVTSGAHGGADGCQAHDQLAPSASGSYAFEYCVAQPFDDAHWPQVSRSDDCVRVTAAS